MSEHIPKVTHSGRGKLGDADVFMHVLPGPVPVIEIASIEPLLGLPESSFGAFLAGLPGGGGRIRFKRASEPCTICKAPASHEVGGVPRCGKCAKGSGHLNTGPTIETVGVPAQSVPSILTAYVMSNQDTPAGQKAHAILSSLARHGLDAFVKRLSQQEPKPPEFVNGKRVHLPKQLNYRTLREEPHRFVGYTGDGRVAFTEEARTLIAKGEVDCETADNLFRELIHASGDARRLRDEAQGLNQWVAKPIGGGAFEVTHRGRTGRFRPITNGKRREARGTTCTVCRRDMPAGATMYVFDRSTEQKETYDPIASHFRYHRACESCMRPDLSAAAMGLSLLASGGAK